MIWCAVVLGTMVGAGLRYLTDRVVSARSAGTFPWGTLLVNVSGCLVAGFFAASLSGSADRPLRLLLVTGLCGGLTTYSTLSFQTLELTKAGKGWRALVNMTGNILVGVGALWCGTYLGQLW